MTGGVVIIPAHDEATVIAATLAPLAPLITAADLQLIVVCNGCTDGTADTARRIPGVTVLEISEASKVAALNAGDGAALGWPRIYLDADISIAPAAVADVIEALHASSRILAARPALRYDVDRASALVRAYYRARSAVPALVDDHLWGAGVYALTERGHRRLGAFPDVVADDVFVDALFARDEIAILDCEPVQVRVPRTASALISILRRVYRGNAALAGGASTGSTIGVGDLVAAVRDVRSALDAVVYLGFALAGRRRAAQPGNGWDKDLTNRVSAGAVQR